MQTAIIQIEFMDGSLYRVNCENKSQIDRIKKWYYSNRDKVKYCTSVLNGIHTTKQFLDIMAKGINK